MSRALTVLLVTVAMAALTGAFGALLTRAAYVPILVPMLLGAATGATVGFMCNAMSFFDGAVPWLAALMGWVTCVGVFHYVEYRDSFVETVRQAHEVEDEWAGRRTLTDEEAANLADRTLVRAVGEGGFIGFLKLRARAGVALRGFGPGPLGSHWSLAFWVMDLLVMAILIVRVGIGAAQRGSA